MRYIRANIIQRIAVVIFGAAVTAAGLQFFLLPNHMLDGGVTGLSILSAKLSGLPLGLFLVLLNAPFVFLGYKKFGRAFACYSILGITTLALLTFVHVEHGFTDVPILAAVFGGMIVGIGVGIVVRYGGIIDGADTIAVLIDRETIFSVSEAIMAINGVIILIAGFVFGWEQAMYSLVAYFVAHKAINVTVEGLDESRCVWVVSMHVRPIGKVINELIREPVTYIREADAKAREPHGIMLVVITRLEEQKVKAAIRAVDPTSYIVMTGAHEVVGKISEHSLYRDAGVRKGSPSKSKA
ncbi:YitT family protein [Candidatus Saccharibacteria bacterium]|nr:YitT family protein [Candidatus Saccharibacteria bacterium]